MKKILSIAFMAFVVVCSSYSQEKGYWQQHVDYTMNIDVNVEKYTYSGTQKLVYTNNSPDTLHRVFYHLYFNAFQPNSEMDIRLQNIADPDARMITKEGESRIKYLKKDEIGYLRIKSLKQNGKKVVFNEEGTILEVTLNQPILSGEKATFEMEFEGQVPVMIRRAGRNSPNGVAFSMAQWYPKMVEYDRDGWNTYPYIAREFHGVWGNFDVTINIDRNYTVAGTGYLQNPQKIGHGYQNESKPLNLQKGKKFSWHFLAPNVHDFTWAADPDFIHDVVPTKSGVTLHFFYKNKEEYKKRWNYFKPLTVKALDYFNKHIGMYPWKQYSVIQGGDGGMEYAMCTLIADRSERAIGTIYHELAHAWFQQLLATNEGKYPWLDEGFTEYASAMAMQKTMHNSKEIPITDEYKRYFYVVENGLEEPLTTHADRYNTNIAYGMGSYTKGYIFLTQLAYIIGKENLDKSLQLFNEKWKFKHPTPQNFRKIVEQVSGIQLGWYFNEWLETTNTIDYGIQSVNKQTITLKRIGKMPMPIDVSITYTDGSTEDFYIPLRMMYGKKRIPATILKNWAWAYPTYTFSVKKPVKKVVIDTSMLMADKNRKNNEWILNSDKQ